MPKSKKLEPSVPTALQNLSELDTLPPESPYSERAEQATEAFHDRLAAGEFDHLYTQRTPEEWRKFISGK